MTIEDHIKKLNLDIERNEIIMEAIRLAVEQERERWLPYVYHKWHCEKSHLYYCGRCICGLTKLLEEKL